MAGFQKHSETEREGGEDTGERGSRWKLRCLFRPKFHPNSRDEKETMPLNGEWQGSGKAVGPQY